MASGSEMLLAAVKHATEGEYTIERELGRGGMAAVYLARDIALDRRVAIKVMLPDLVDVEGLADRFLVEARTAAHLDHPGIVTVYSVKQREGLLFIVMKYIAGNTLEGVLRSGTPLSADVASTLIGQVAEALQYAHAEGVVHRDVKPSNILVDIRGRPVIADFGIAKVTSGASMTVTGALIGTPAYMSPEQCRGLAATSASDQYSLGVVAFEMFARRTPFSGSLFELIHAHCDLEPDSLRTLAPGTNDHVCDAIARMMAKHPKDRWPSLAEVVRVFSGDALRGRDSARIRADIAELARTQTVAAGKVRAQMSPPPDTERLTTPAPALVVTPGDPQIEVGATLQLRVSESSGASLVGIRIEWRTEDPSIATVDGSGVVTGVGVGLAKVTATGGAAIGRVSVSVREAQVNTLVVTPQNPDVDAHDEVQLVVTALDARGNVMAKPQVVWVSSDVGVCAISQQGRAIGIVPGRVTVTARLGNTSGSTTLRVRPPAVTRVHVEPGELGIEVEEKRAILATVIGPMDRALADRAVQWRSTVPAVAIVSADGSVEGVAPGTAAILATAEGKEGICSVVVRAQPVAAVRIQPARLHLELGRSLQLEGLAEDRKGRTLSGRNIEWSSDDNRIAIVDASGKVHGAALGRTTVTAVAGPAASTIEVQVVPRPVAQIQLAAHSHSLKIGSSLALSVTLFDGDGSQVGARPVSWTSSDPAVASVDAKGVVHAKCEGAVRITVTSEQAKAATKLSVIAVAATAPEERATAPMPVVRASEPVPTTPASAPVARGSRRGVVVTVGVLVLAAGAYGVWMKSRPSAGRASTAVTESTAPAANPASQPDAGAGGAASNAAAPGASPGPTTNASLNTAVAKQSPTAPPSAASKSTVTKTDARSAGRGDAAGTAVIPAAREGAPSQQSPPPSAAIPERARVESTTVAGRGDSGRGAAASSPPVAAEPPPTRPDPAPVTIPAPAASRVVESVAPAFNRALLCENASVATGAFNAQAGSDPARQLVALYQPRDRGFESLNSLVKDASRLRATPRAMRNEAVGQGCEWMMEVDFNFTNAFGQPRRRTVQLRLELEAAGTGARVKRVFGATGF